VTQQASPRPLDEGVRSWTFRRTSCSRWPSSTGLFFA
jgi:hypothetical protein